MLYSWMGNFRINPISCLRTFILCMEYHFYTCSQDHPFVSKIVIWVNDFMTK